MRFRRNHPFHPRVGAVAPIKRLWLEFVRGGEPWERYDCVGGSTIMLGSECGLARERRAEQPALWERRHPGYA
ncbi:hypothetical protein MPSYJ_46680 [Mycolicibacterium psychrotolerans]|uniref:Uncharacterized protein n=1 Tax=Mycolicibacterium psychrotolerans TaxID=216929 RepID=A0A7I7MHF1_9MYCO|nr:hypothetical protein MPSYJ_46680 [Mycolicibacterium psychrotolerans]